MIREQSKKMAVWAALGLLCATVTGCGGGNGQQAAASSGNSQETAGKEPAQSLTGGNQESQTKAVSIICDSGSVEINGDGAVYQDGKIRITKEGSYALSGEFSGQVAVEASDKDDVELILNGFSVSCETSSPIYGIECDTLTVTLADETVNSVMDGAEYVFASADEDEPDAAIFTKTDLVIGGSGKLTINGSYSNGIRSKDDLSIRSGVIEVTARKDAIKGRDSLTIDGGQITVTSGEDGLKSNNDEDEDKGYVVINSGTIEIHAGDDGIHAETALTVNGGAITIAESYEGLEGLNVTIHDGTIRVTSSDDGINAAGGSDGEDAEWKKMQSNSSAFIKVTGGTVYVDAEGDGLDSNGDLYVEGGTVYVSGPESSNNGALDYNGKAIISAGTVIAAGSSGMAQSFSEESVQNVLMVYFAAKKEAKTAMTVMDSQGMEVLRWEPEKAYDSVVISAPQIVTGETYTVTAGDEKQEMTVEGVLTQAGEQTGGGMDRMGGKTAGGKAAADGLGRPESQDIPKDPGRPENGDVPEDLGRPGSADMPENPRRADDGEGPGRPSGGERPEMPDRAAGGGQRPDGSTEQGRGRNSSESSGEGSSQ